MPNIDEKHANEMQIVLVVADKRAGASMKGTASTTYEIDTRPDAVLEPFQKAERANKGVTGKAKTQLMTQGAQHAAELQRRDRHRREARRRSDLPQGRRRRMGTLPIS